MHKLVLGLLSGIGGAVVAFIAALFFDAPPSRAEFVKVKTVQEALVEDVGIIKSDVKTLLKRVK